MCPSRGSEVFRGACDSTVTCVRGAYANCPCHRLWLRLIVAYAALAGSWLWGPLIDILRVGAIHWG